jgi:hypothetical protein
MLPMIPPFRADYFACPRFGSPSPWSLFLAPPFSSPALHMQTLRQRKVAAARENKWPQLFGGFVLMASAFLPENALLRLSRYSDKTIGPGDTVD